MKRHLQFTMHRASGLTLQRHQILRLPRKMTRMIDARHIWNVIYNARSNRHHPPTSPNTAPATQNCIPKSKRNLQKIVQASLIYNGGQFENDPRMIRTWSEHEIAKLNPAVRRAYFSPLGNAFCIENYNISRCDYLPQIHQILRLPRKVTLQHHQMLRLPPRMTLMIDARRTWNVIYNLQCTGHQDLTLQRHQILRLPRKMTRMIDARHIWNVTCNAQSNRTHPPTSPNTAPAAQICTPKSKRNLPKTVQASFTMADDSRMIRTWSEHEIAKLNPAVRRAYFSLLGNHFVLKITIFRAAAIYPKFTKYSACHEKWHSNITKCCACL